MILPVTIAAKHSHESPTSILEHVAASIHTQCPVAEHASFVDRFDGPFGELNRRDIELIALALSVGMLVGRVQKHQNPGNAARVRKILQLPEDA